MSLFHQFFFHRHAYINLSTLRFCFMCCVLRVGCWVLRRVDRALSSFFAFSVKGSVGMVKCSNCFKCFNRFSPAPLPLTEPAVQPAAAGAMSHFDSIGSLLATVENGSVKPLSGKYLLRLAQGGFCSVSFFVDPSFSFVLV